ncbi:MAG: hypothetical protein LBE06_07385 [Azoarcus sp.]|nr:hypothetical protein [Azoarcus sp.]
MKEHTGGKYDSSQQNKKHYVITRHACLVQYCYQHEKRHASRHGENIVGIESRFRASQEEKSENHEKRHDEKCGQKDGITKPTHNADPTQNASPWKYAEQACQGESKREFLPAHGFSPPPPAAQA